MRNVFIEVFDDRVKAYPVIKQEFDDVAVFFVYEKNIRRQISFSGALFVDDYAFTNAVYRYPRSRRICLLQESPNKGFVRRKNELIDRFDIVFTFDKKLLDSSTIFKRLYYGTSRINKGYPCKGSTFLKRKLCSFVGSIQHLNSHGYSFRKDIALLLQADNRVDCWGRGIREFEVKEDVTGPYKFCVVMENCQRDCYFTEKLIDCFVTETVPIYWGCPSIGEVFNPYGILCFNTVDDLKVIIDSISDARYESMLSALADNKDRSFSMQLTRHSDYLSRLAGHLFNCHHPSINAGRLLYPVERMKVFACLRLLSEIRKRWFCGE